MRLEDAVVRQGRELEAPVLFGGLLSCPYPFLPALALLFGEIDDVVHRGARRVPVMPDQMVEGVELEEHQAFMGIPLVGQDEVVEGHGPRLPGRRGD